MLKAYIEILIKTLEDMKTSPIAVTEYDDVALDVIVHMLGLSESSTYTAANLRDLRTWTMLLSVGGSIESLVPLYGGSLEDSWYVTPEILDDILLSFGVEADMLATHLIVDAALFWGEYVSRNLVIMFSVDEEE